MIGSERTIAAPRMDFTLVDGAGARTTQETYRGKFALVYFGFTHCRVVCPRSLAKLSDVVDRLGDLRLALVPLYISVDPARDTPARMREYLSDYPLFIGLTGSEAAIEDAKRAFRIFARRADDPEDAQGYSVPHTAIAYLMGPGGEYVDHFPDAVDPDVIVGRIAGHLRTRGIQPDAV